MFANFALNFITAVTQNTAERDPFKSYFHD